VAPPLQPATPGGTSILILKCDGWAVQNHLVPDGVTPPPVVTPSLSVLPPPPRLPPDTHSRSRSGPDIQSRHSAQQFTLFVQRTGIQPSRAGNAAARCPSARDRHHVDETSIKDVAGVVKVGREGNFLGVVAESEWGEIKEAQKINAS